MARVEIDEAEWTRFRTAVAAGIFNLGGQVERASKALTPVYGDPAQGGEYRTRAPGARPIGGTLRRSQHTVVYIDGKRQFGPSQDENRNQIPAYATGKGIEGFVGTNIEYAVYVHDGTVRMTERPFLARGWADVQPRAVQLISAGFKKAYGR